MASFMDIKTVLCSEVFYANFTFIGSIAVVNLEVLLHIANVCGYFVAEKALHSIALAFIQLH